MVVRRLGAGDSALALELVERFHAGDVSESYLRELLATPRNVLFTAHVGTVLAGFAWAYWLQRLRLERRRLFVYEIEVAPEFRRRGIGSQLMRALTAEATRESADVFLLTERSNTGAVAFYESLGARARKADDVLFTLGEEG